MNDIKLIHYESNLIPPKVYTVLDKVYFGWSKQFDTLIPDYFELRTRNIRSNTEPSKGLFLGQDLYHGDRETYQEYWFSNAPLEKKILVSLAVRRVSLILDEDRKLIIEALTPISKTQTETKGITNLVELLETTKEGPMVLCIDNYYLAKRVYKCDDHHSPLINHTNLAAQNPETDNQKLTKILETRYIGRDLQQLIKENMLVWQPIEYLTKNIPRVTQRDDTYPHVRISFNPVTVKNNC